MKIGDANVILTKPPSVKYVWLMSLKTDWFVWDFHDRQNISLNQSIGASVLTHIFIMSKNSSNISSTICDEVLLGNRVQGSKQLSEVAFSDLAVVLPGNQTVRR